MPVLVRRVAVPLAGAAALLTVCALVLDARNAAVLGHPEDEFLADIWLGLVLPPAGAYLIRRVGSLRVGVVLLAGIFLAVAAAAGQLAGWLTVVRPSPGVVRDAAAWLATWTWTPYLLFPTLVPLLHPTGRPLSRAWGRLGIAVGVLVLTTTVAAALAPGTVPGTAAVSNPWSVESARWLTTVVDALAAVTVVLVVPLCILAAVVRWWRAPALAREDSGWFAASVVVMWATLVFGDGLGYPWADVLTAAGLTLPLLVVVLGGTARAEATALRRSREQLVVAREEERLRLHRDLHDGLGPELAGVSLSLAAAARSAEDVALREQLSAAQLRLQEMTTEVRHIVEDLRPAALDTLGLAEALRQQVDALARPAGLDVTVTVPEPLPPLAAAVQVAAYRIAVEALVNVVRHAAAHRCLLVVRLDDHGLEVEVTDDGAGPGAVSQPGHGLTTMRSRAEELGGCFGFDRSAAGGSRVLVRLPLVAT